MSNYNNEFDESRRNSIDLAAQRSQRKVDGIARSAIFQQHAGRHIAILYRQRLPQNSAIPLVIISGRANIARRNSSFATFRLQYPGEFNPCTFDQQRRRRRNSNRVNEDQ